MSLAIHRRSTGCLDPRSIDRPDESRQTAMRKELRLPCGSLVWGMMVLCCVFPALDHSFAKAAEEESTIVAEATYEATASDPMYMLSSSTCGLIGCKEITSVTRCRAAAAALASWKYFPTVPPRYCPPSGLCPPRCFLFGGRGVSFNPHLGQSCVSRGRPSCICECPTNGTTAQVARREEGILRVLFDATNGSHWRYKEGWKGGSSASTPTLCGWYGILCNSGHVHTIYLKSNNLDGTIPPQIGGLSFLHLLGFMRNSLHGSIPPSLGSLNSLTQIALYDNKLRGSIPRQVGNLSKLIFLSAANNDLSGTIPPQIGRIKALTILGFGNTNLEGSIPPQIGQLNSLSTLDLYNNSLRGTLPPQLGNLYLLKNVKLQNNGLTGSIPPEMGSMKSLIYIMLQNNSLQGGLPAGLCNLTSLILLQADSNSLTGPIPLELSQSTSLQYLALSHNQLTGSIVVLPPRIKVLTIHTNRFTGVLPSFASLYELRYLTLFGNQFRGRLDLPASSNLEIMFAHNNRLSCPVTALNTTINSKQNLVIPGNSISCGPSLPWMRMRNVDFLYAMPTWETWSWNLISLAIGPVVLLVGLAWCWLPNTGQNHHTSTEWARALVAAVVFSPRGEIELMQMWCAKVLAIWSILGLIILWPLYSFGANLYECGEAWLSVTIVHLWGSPATEWLCAIAACPFAFMWATSIRRLEWNWFAQESVALRHSDHSWSWAQRVLLQVIWLPVVCILCIPGVFYSLSLSLPPGDENTMGIGSYEIEGSHYSIGIVVFVISGYVVPKSALKVVQFVLPNSPGVTQGQISGRLMMAARFFIVVLSPLVTVLCINQDCFAKWLLLWTPCSGEGTFATRVSDTVSYVYTNHGRQFSASFHVRIGVTEHADVCTPTYIADGRCPRALLVTLGGLHIRKLAFAVYFSPLINLLMATPFAHATKEWLVRTLLRKSSYQSTKKLSREVAGVVMMMELPIILGFAMPIITLLACLGTALNACVFHTAVRMGTVLTDEIKASSHYLWISLVIGCILPSWLYMESGLHGRFLVLFGMPLSAVCGAYVPWDRLRPSTRVVNQPALREALLPGESTATMELDTAQSGL